MKKESVAIIDALIIFIFIRCLLPSVLHKIRYMLFKYRIELIVASSSTNATKNDSESGPLRVKEFAAGHMLI